MFIDIHCHILPGVDDGAETMEESCEMIRRAYQNGTGMMLATPHYMNPIRSHPDNTISSLRHTYLQLKAELASRNIPVQLYLGCEFLANSSISALYKKNLLLPINASRYLITEFEFDEDIRNVLSWLQQLRACGLVPIIAHPERYDFLNENPTAVVNFIQIGCKIQINKGSLLGQHGHHAQIYAEWLLNNNFVHLIASDCHHIAYRDADLSVVYGLLKERYPDEMLQALLHENPKRILLDKEI